MINAVESNQLDLNAFLFFYYKDISLSYNFLRCLTFSNLGGKPQTAAHPHGCTVWPGNNQGSFWIHKKSRRFCKRAGLSSHRWGFPTHSSPPSLPSSPLQEKLVHFCFFPIT